MGWEKQQNVTAETNNQHLRLSYYRRAGETVCVLEITNTNGTLEPAQSFTLAEALAGGFITQAQHDGFLAFAAGCRDCGLSKAGYTQV